MKKNRLVQTLVCLLRHVWLCLLCVASIFPLLWILISAFKGRGELMNNPTGFIPRTWTLEYFRHVIFDLNFITNIKNSVLIALATTLVSVSISSLAAYAIVRFFPRFGSLMTKFLVTTYIFPPILLAIPYSLVMARAGLGNTRLGLVIVYLSFSLPYAVWLLTGFFRNIPIGIEEAARVDGAGQLTICTHIVFPIAAPGIVATAVYTFINAWNEFLYALILISDSRKMTVAVALRSLDGAEILDWGDMMAASVLVVIPSIIFFCLIQNKIAGGLADGSVK